MKVQINRSAWIESQLDAHNDTTASENDPDQSHPMHYSLQPVRYLSILYAVLNSLVLGTRRPASERRATLPLIVGQFVLNCSLERLANIMGCAV